jgi:hypothetical protein
VKLSKAWCLGGAVYTLAVVVAVVLRLWRPSDLPPQIASAVISISDFSTLPPYFSLIGVYPGMLLAGFLKDLTGLPASSYLTSDAAWAVTVLGAATVAAADVFLAHAIWRLVRRRCSRPRRVATIR